MISTANTSKRQALHYLAVDPFDCDTVHLYEHCQYLRRAVHRMTIRVEDLGDLFGATGEDIRRKLEDGDDATFLRGLTEVSLGLVLAPSGKAVR